MKVRQRHVRVYCFCHLHRLLTIHCSLLLLIIFYRRPLKNAQFWPSTRKAISSNAGTEIVSAFPDACDGVSERIKNIRYSLRSKILCS